MRRRDFINLLGGTAVGWPLVAQAQQASRRMLRVGALIGFAEHDPATQRRVAAFLKGLADLGWTLDRNVAIDFRYGAGDADRNRAFAKELVSLNPDVIFVNSTSATAAVQRETTIIPVVFATVSDPVGSGFVASLARPGGNITGFVNVEASIAGKWLGLLKEVAPGIKRAGLMYNPTTATYFEYYLKPFEVAAEAAGVKSTSLTVGNRNPASFRDKKPRRRHRTDERSLSDGEQRFHQREGAAVSYPRCFRRLAKRLSHNLCAGYRRPLSTLRILC